MATCLDFSPQSLSSRLTQNLLDLGYERPHFGIAPQPHWKRRRGAGGSWELECGFSHGPAETWQLESGGKEAGSFSFGSVCKHLPPLRLCQPCGGGCIYLELDKGKINLAQLVIERPGEMLQQ